jgi:hypothetical protein
MLEACAREPDETLPAFRNGARRSG